MEGLVWGLVWVGLGWFRVFVIMFMDRSFRIRNPCTGAHVGVLKWGWFGVGLGLVWLGLGVVCVGLRNTNMIL